MSLVNQRIFVEKKPGFQTEAETLFATLKENFNLKADGLRLINTYDVFHIEEDVLKEAIQTVFTEVMVDDVLETVELDEKSFAMETLPGQYDQRADSAQQCVRLLNPSSACVITTGKVVQVLGECTQEELVKIQNYMINPIESRLKDLSKLEIDRNVDVTPLESFAGFIQYTNDELKAFRKRLGLAMSDEDLALVQKYFKDEEQRDPRETEIKVLDTYWSDHCRHTTFETCLKSIEIKSEKFHDAIEEAYDLYLNLRHECGRDEKPVTLMDMATINGRTLKKRHLADDVEVSEEINACSVFVDVDHDGVIEKWLLQFKNETHNHPTEIEPFGGASTCIGGAIRDPLSGRSYVYQAMRISGCGDVFQPVDKTLKGKLPQKVISKKATAGNSSYGNQIGLATTFVKEIYHDKYVAKHMEVGAVAGAVKAEYVKRETPQPGDVVILLGGRTGRDGIGGATGSSKEHTTASLDTCASEVQKGNAPEERKIQRLFRNPEVTTLIKKCNDFGAGGVCVAIGELAEGLVIHLDKVRTKYAGLNATELAISESQERMAVVIAKEDKEKFIELAHRENLEAYQVAEVTDTKRLVMLLHDEVIVDISREFVDTAGVRQNADVLITDQKGSNPFVSKELNKENILDMLAAKEVCSQKGLVENFDASIGSTTVLMPYGGVTQLTPSQASVQKLPVLDGKTTTCSVMTYGYNPRIMDYSCFIGAQYSVLDSMAKTVAVGGSLDHVYFSFQEYFERLNKDAHRWGKVTEALLGTIKVQDFFNKAAIGGKDSMSGTFQDLDVPPTLISFACSPADTKNIITPELKKAGNKLSVLLPKFGKDMLPDLESYKRLFETVEKGIRDRRIFSAYVAEEGGILAALLKMSFGYRMGFEVNTDVDLLQLIPSAIVIEHRDEIEGAVELGTVCEKDYLINGIELSYEEAVGAWTKTLESLYPTTAKAKTTLAENADYVTKNSFKSEHLVDEVNVLIPVFPGNNCEYDMKRAFEEEGAKCTIFVFRNMSEQDVNESIDEMAALLDKTQIFAIPGGFSSGDEPDGSAKFIVNVLCNEKIKAALHRLKERDGLIIGICNGFQALIKSGLLPYGEVRTLSDHDSTLVKNDINRHISCMVNTRAVSNNSPWLSGMTVGEVHAIAVSHGEGKFVVQKEELEKLLKNGQIAFQYCDELGNATMDEHYNFNGSTYAIEGIVSEDGRVLGKMGHSERYFTDVFKNIPGNKKQSIFRNGVNYFKKGE